MECSHYNINRIDVFVPSNLSGHHMLKGHSQDICPNCDGTGSADKQQHKCKYCSDGYTKSCFFGSLKVCIHCNGTGKNIKIPCCNCNGSGYIHSIYNVDVNITDGVIDYPVTVANKHVALHKYKYVNPRNCFYCHCNITPFEALYGFVKELKVNSDVVPIQSYETVKQHDKRLFKWQDKYYLVEFHIKNKKVKTD